MLRQTKSMQASQPASHLPANVIGVAMQHADAAGALLPVAIQLCAKTGQSVLQPCKPYSDISIPSHHTAGKLEKPPPVAGFLAMGRRARAAGQMTFNVGHQVGERQSSLHQPEEACVRQGTRAGSTRYPVPLLVSRPYLLLHALCPKLDCTPAHLVRGQPAPLRGAKLRLLGIMHDGVCGWEGARAEGSRAQNAASCCLGRDKISCKDFHLGPPLRTLSHLPQPLPQSVCPGQLSPLSAHSSTVH